MIHTKYLLLGAGPAGLALTNLFLRNGETDFLVLEREREAGGLCRSVTVDGTPFDTGGGHFLDTRDDKVLDFVFSFMPESEWALYKRKSCISIDGMLIDHPLEANIWQFPVEKQVEYLKSIAQAGCNQGAPKPEQFVDWIRWKLGELITNEYMLPYNRKMFMDNLNHLGTYWMDKLPDVSFEETLKSCLEKRAYGRQPGHASFYYPLNYGYGELWRRMALAPGARILYKQNAAELDCEKRTVVTEEGRCFCGEHIITTIPWKAFRMIRNMPDRLIKIIEGLEHTQIQTEYFKEDMDTDAQWIYYPDPAKDYHRILVCKNFYKGGQGFWTETNLKRASGGLRGVRKYVNEYAYPLNTIRKPQQMEELLTWCRSRNIYGLGRWGEHMHYNSDVTVRKAADLYNELKPSVPPGVLCRAVPPGAGV